MLTCNRGIAALAIACFIGAFASTPSEVRSRLGPAHDMPAIRALAEPASLAAIRPNGDPFVPRADDPEPMRNLAIAEFPGIAPLPANAGAGRLPLAAVLGPPAFVSATILGPHPSALVVDDRTTRLVTVGDRVAGARIVAITADGITLDDGRRLTLSSVRMTAR